MLRLRNFIRALDFTLSEQHGRGGTSGGQGGGGGGGGVDREEWKEGLRSTYDKGSLC